MTKTTDEKWEKRPRRFGKSTLVTNQFLAACKAGESVKYEHPDFVAYSRKAFSILLSQSKEAMFQEGWKVGHDQTKEDIVERVSKSDLNNQRGVFDSSDDWLDGYREGKKDMKKFILQLLESEKK